jgi:hypothetical protein
MKLVLDLNFTLATATPQTTLLTPIPGGNHSSTARLIGTATDIGTNLSNLQYSVDGGSLNTLNTDTSGKFDDSPPFSPLAIGSHTSVIEATDTAGNQTSQNINFQVTNSLTVAPHKQQVGEQHQQTPYSWQNAIANSSKLYCPCS